MFPGNNSPSGNQASPTRRGGSADNRRKRLDAHLVPTYLDFNKQSVSTQTGSSLLNSMDTLDLSGGRLSRVSSSSSSQPADEISDSESETGTSEGAPLNQRPGRQNPAFPASPGTSSSSGGRTGRQSPFSDYDEYRQARWNARCKLAQGAFLAAGCIVAGILAVVCPPVLAVGAALATGAGGLIFSTVKNFFSLASDLAENPSFLTQYKKKVKTLSKTFKNWVNTQVDPLRKNPRYQPHAEFLKRLSNTLDQFSQRIQDKDYQEVMEEALGVEKHMLEMVDEHVLSHGRERDKQRIFTVQSFLRKYDEYLSKLPEDSESLREVDQLRLDHILKKARESAIPELVEWSQRPNNLAESLARLQFRNDA